MSDHQQISPIMLSAQPASRDQRRLALAVSLLLLAAFVVTLPFAEIHGPPAPGLVLVQQTWQGINDLITAVLLFGQYSVRRMRGLNILAGGYLFTALTTIPYALSFPGAFSQAGLLTGPLSPPWLFLGWYAALPLTVIAYGLYPVRGGKHDRGSGILVAVFAAVGAMAALTLLVTVGYEWLPTVRGSDGNYTTVAQVAIDTLAGLAVLALLVLARRRPYSVLDIWLMVVMFAWLCAMIVGGGVIRTGRYDVGNDIERVIFMLAAIFVLLVLLSEINVLYARAVRDHERRLREMEAVLIHLSRVSQLGQNVSSLIHEVNQPLAAILNYLTAAARLSRAGGGERLNSVLERTSEQARRAVDIIRHLRDFVAKRETDKQVEDLSRLIEAGVRLALVGSNVPRPAIDIRVDPAASSAFLDRVQIEQVVFNLVRNALEAMAATDDPSLVITTARADDNGVEIKIADNGPGLSAQIREKIFEPFVTTKASGLGVGLSICRVIVEAHGGRLQAEDNLGRGTVFRFTLSPTAKETTPLLIKEDRRIAG